MSVELKDAALRLAREMIVANSLDIPRTLEKIDEALAASAAPAEASNCCPHGIHYANACGACIPPRGTSISPAEGREWNQVIGPVTIDRTHANQAYVTLGFGREDLCTTFIRAINDLYVKPRRATIDAAEGRKYAYPTIDDWLTETAGEREVGHVVSEMTHTEVARQAFAAARARSGAPAEGQRVTTYSTTDGYRCGNCGEGLGAHSQQRYCQPSAPAEGREEVDERGAVRAMTDVLLAAWQKAEPTHSITQYPESYKATFMDMARAALATAPTMSEAVRDVLAERKRVIEQEEFTAAHDDQWTHGQLATAAGCYAMFSLAYPAGDPVKYWPWDKEWWKPSTDKRRNLVKAMQLLIAEIERIDRAAAKGGRDDA